jgi:hypothetical protein
MVRRRGPPWFKPSRGKAPVARGFFLGDYVGLGQNGTAYFPFFTITTQTDPANIVTREVGP